MRNERIPLERMVSILCIAAWIIGITMMVLAAFANAAADRTIAEADAFLEAQETHTNTLMAKPAHQILPKELRYTHELELIGKVTGFEVGYCCSTCRYYVASACYNRMTYWYGGDAEAMITDGTDEYYMMYPDYVWMEECHGWNFHEHYTEIMAEVWAAVKNPADIWFWDCDDTQNAWAELVWHCQEDGMWFYK